MKTLYWMFVLRHLTYFLPVEYGDHVEVAHHSIAPGTSTTNLRTRK